MISKHRCWVLLVVLGVAAHAWAADSIRVVKHPKAEGRNAFYGGNRAPLTPSPLIKLPIGAIRPEGWLRAQLQLQAEGFFGHLTELSHFLKKEGNAWLSAEGKGHSGWEEVPYWLRGFGDLGYVLGDERILTEAKIWIEAVLSSQREDGYFGPRDNLQRIRGRQGAVGTPDVWPHMVMLDALQSYYEWSGDKRVPALMAKYFHWQTTVPDEDFLLPFWQNQRAGDNLASVYWLYNLTGETWLLDLAAKVHRNTAKWADGIPSWHNVNIAQAFRQPAIYYQQSKNARHHQAAERNYQEVWGLYGQVPGGMFGGDENCRKGYYGPRQAIETCGMVEMMHSCEMLIKIDGDGNWADRCEDVAFNSLPAATTADFKALRYLTAPNQIRSDSKNKSPGVQNRGAMMLMIPHRHRCCQHNMGHGWPYLAEHLWMATPDNGLAAVFYCASEVKAKAGEGGEVTVAETTRYPFEDKIVFEISTPKAVQFPLYLRVPGWCDKPVATTNGKRAGVEAGPNSYIMIDRKWDNGDKVVLNLPMRITLRTWEKNKNCVSVNYGPLTYSLKIGEKYVAVDPFAHLGANARKQLAAAAGNWGAWEIHPTTPWNYGLVLDKADPAASFKVVPKTWPDDNRPFELDDAPIELKAQGRKIPDWKEDELGLVGLIPASPVKSSEPTETITLVPMGCARLRIAAFPTIGGGGKAQ